MATDNGLQYIQSTDKIEDFVDFVAADHRAIFANHTLCLSSEYQTASCLFVLGAICSFAGNYCVYGFKDRKKECYIDHRIYIHVDNILK